MVCRWENILVKFWTVAMDTDADASYTDKPPWSNGLNWGNGDVSGEYSPVSNVGIWCK